MLRTCLCPLYCISLKNFYSQDFPGGPVVKDPPSNAGDVGSIPSQGTKIPQATGQLSPRTTTTEPARVLQGKIPHAAKKIPRAATKT